MVVTRELISAPMAPTTQSPSLMDTDLPGQRDLHPGVRTGDGRLARLTSRLEAALFHGGWPVRVARTLGVRPSVRTVHHAVTVSSVSGGAPPLRMAYASDFHSGPLTDPALLESACAQLRALDPDLLLLGGDFVTGEPDELG